MLNRLGLLLAALALGALLVNTQARACECGRIAEPREACNQADSVFTGTVVSIEDHVTWWRNAWIRLHNWVADEKLCASSESWVKDCGFEITLTIDESLKGAKGPTVTVRTGRGGGDCAYPFQTGKRYLVYANRYPTGELTTNRCDRTRPVENAADDLSALKLLFD